MIRQGMRLASSCCFALTLSAALIDDFQDAQGPQSGPGCSTSLTVSLSGAGRELCPGASTASINVASGFLDILNTSGGGASAITYSVSSGLAGTYSGLYLDVVQSDASNMSVQILVGALSQSFNLPANTIGRVDLLASSTFTLAAGDLITITFSGSTGWDLTLGPTLQASSVLKAPSRDPFSSRLVKMRAGSQSRGDVAQMDRAAAS